jgi:hypothetical protein
VWVLASSTGSGGFVTADFGVIAPRPTPNLEDPGLHSVCSDPLICLAWVALPGDYAPASIAFRVVGARNPLMHYKMAVLAEVKYLLLLNLYLKSVESCTV